MFILSLITIYDPEIEGIFYNMNLNFSLENYLPNTTTGIEWIIP